MAPLIRALLIALFVTTSSWAKAPLLVITDIDDTIRISRILSRGDDWDKYQRLLMKQEAFSGAKTLLQTLDEGGAKIVYLSAAPKQVAWVPKKFLESQNFPQRESLILKPDPGSDTYRYKLRNTIEVIAAHPGYEVILIGDNAEKDIAAYQSVVKYYASKNPVIATFIHDLYRGSPAPVVTKSQTPFLTFAEVTAHLEDKGIVSRDLTDAIVRETLTDLSDSERSALVVPSFVELKKKDLEKIYALLPYSLDELFDRLALMLLHQKHELHPN